jgi:hypothetical protein
MVGVHNGTLVDLGDGRLCIAVIPLQLSGNEGSPLTLAQFADAIVGLATAANQDALSDLITAGVSIGSLDENGVFAINGARSQDSRMVAEIAYPMIPVDITEVDVSLTGDTTGIVVAAGSHLHIFKIDCYYVSGGASTIGIESKVNNGTTLAGRRRVGADAIDGYPLPLSLPGGNFYPLASGQDLVFNQSGAATFIISVQSVTVLDTADPGAH